VSPSDCDNDRKPQMTMWPSKPEMLISLESGTMTDRATIPTANNQREETDPGRLRQRPTTRNNNIDVLGANLAISGSRVVIENPEFGVGISTPSVRVPEM